MARLARAVVPGVARHVTQRGNRRQQISFQQVDLWRRHERTGRPLGKPSFPDRIERLLGRRIRPAKRGPKPKQREN